MNIVLLDVPKKNGEFLKESLCHCKHILDLDFLRDEMPSNIADDEPTYAFTHTVREKAKLSKYNRRKLGEHLHILFFEYPEHNLLDDEDDDECTLYGCCISTIVETKVQLPDFFTQQGLIDISPLYSVSDCINIMSRNVNTIKDNLDNEKTWVVHAHMYRSILEELNRLSFNYKDKQILIALLDKVDIILHYYRNESQKMDIVTERNILRDVKAKNEEYCSILDKIESVEITLEPNDNGDWLYDFTEEFNIMMNGDLITIRSAEPEKLIDLYSKLSSIMKGRIRLVVNDCSTNDTQKRMETHVIEGESTPWAYVFYRMYGENAKYTKDRDDKVNEVIKISNKMQIPIDYVI